MRRLGLGLLLAPARRVARVWRGTRRSVAVVPDLIEAILVLPEISRQLEVVAFQTATLPEMYEEIRRVRGDTAAMPDMDARLARLVEVAVPLQATAMRFGRLADRWPQRRALSR